MKSTAQGLLWEALKQAGLDCESQYPLQDDFPHYVADFVLFCRSGRVAVIIAEELGSVWHVGEGHEIVADFLAQSGNWQLFKIEASAAKQDPVGCVMRLAALVNELGGLADLPNEESPRS